ncbi:MAG: DinB family protein [Planctomycetes bacterium]|nr:DinB family protein [Planctomycetota bacterium]
MTAQTPTNVPERYVKALDDAEPLEVLRKMPKRLRRLLREAKSKELDWKADPATWSVREIVGHLADNEFVFGARVRFVAAEERPLLPAYDEKRFVAGLGLDRSSVEDLFDAWVAARAANLEMLRRLPESAWTRIGVHAERGELSLAQIVIGAAGHDRVHEEQVERTLARARAARRELKQRAKAEARSRKEERPAKQKSAKRAGQAGAAREVANGRKVEARSKETTASAKAAPPARTTTA